MYFRKNEVNIIRKFLLEYKDFYIDFLDSPNLVIDKTVIDRLQADFKNIDIVLDKIKNNEVKENFRKVSVFFEKLEYSESDGGFLVTPSDSPIYETNL